MEVVPARLVELAQEHLAASTSLTSTGGDTQPRLQLDGRAAGDTPGGASFTARHGTLAETAGVALDRLAGVLEQGYDALLACAFDVSTTDEAQADRYHRYQLPPFLTPTTEGAA